MIGVRTRLWSLQDLREGIGLAGGKDKTAGRKRIPEKVHVIAAFGELLKELALRNTTTGQDDSIHVTDGVFDCGVDVACGDGVGVDGHHFFHKAKLYALFTEPTQNPADDVASEQLSWTIGAVDDRDLVAFGTQMVSYGQWWHVIVLSN